MTEEFLKPKDGRKFIIIMVIHQQDLLPYQAWLSIHVTVFTRVEHLGHRYQNNALLILKKAPGEILHLSSDTTYHCRSAMICSM